MQYYNIRRKSLRRWLPNYPTQKLNTTSSARQQQTTFKKIFLFVPLNTNLFLIRWIISIKIHFSWIMYNRWKL